MPEKILNASYGLSKSVLGEITAISSDVLSGKKFLNSSGVLDTGSLNKMSIELGEFPLVSTHMTLSAKEGAASKGQSNENFITVNKWDAPSTSSPSIYTFNISGDYRLQIYTVISWLSTITITDKNGEILNNNGTGSNNRLEYDDIVHYDVGDTLNIVCYRNTYTDTRMALVWMNIYYMS